MIFKIRGFPPNSLSTRKMSGRGKLAKTFSLNLLSGASKISISSSATFSEVKVQLGEGTQQSQRKVISAFLWLDRKTQGRTRVEDEAGFQKFIGAVRDHLIAGLGAEGEEKLRALEESEWENKISEEEEKELAKLRTIDEEIVVVGSVAKSDVHEEGGYDPEKLRAERLKRQAEAEEKENNKSKKGGKDPSDTVKIMSLRFPKEENKDKKGGGGVELSAVPFSSSWEDICDALASKFKRIVHFRYQTDKKLWRDVRSPEAWARFKQEMGAEWMAQGAATGVAEVQLLPFGTGSLPLLGTWEDVSVFGFTHDVIKAKARLLPLVSMAAMAATDEAGAATQARAIVQQPKSKAYEEVDDLHRSALHLAALKGYHLLAEALLSAPSDVRSIMVSARDHMGRTPLHYASTEAVAKALLQAKADPRATDERGGTPLHAVTAPDVAILLLRGKKHGGLADAQVNARDKAGLSPLLAHVSRPKGGAMAECLVDRANGIINSDDQPVQVDLKAADQYGRTALHIAALSNNHVTLQTLVRSGQVDINAKDNFGMTALHVSSRADHIKSVSYLVGQNCDVSIRDSAGKTATEVTLSKGIKRMLESSAQSRRLFSSEA